MTLFKRARYKLPNGEYITAPLPEGVRGHFGDGLREFIVTQYHCNNVTQNKIHKELVSRGISISEGTINAILTDATAKLEPEYDGILEAAKQVSTEVRTDDTEGRHNGVRHFHTVLQNDLFTIIQSSQSKSRKSLLQIMRGKMENYVLNEDAIAYIKRCGVREEFVTKIETYIGTECATKDEWTQFLETIGINACTTGKNNLITLDQAGIFGALIHNGWRPDLILLSDGAPQFKKIFPHQLCWIHAERIIKRLVPVNDGERKEIDHIVGQIWDFYDALKIYKVHPENDQKQILEEQFSKIFLQAVNYEKLRDAMLGFYRLKKELLLVLEHPEIPLHNNSSERDIRSVVCKRKISGSTRSNMGYKARNIFPSIIKTCQKLGISYLEFIRDRLSTKPIMESLESVIRSKSCFVETPTPSS